MSILLTRDIFRNSVFERDEYKCVICGEPAKDVHHIINRIVGIYKIKNPNEKIFLRI